LEEPRTPDEPGVSRRRFQHWTLATMPIVYGLGILTAIIRYMIPLPSRRLPKLDAGAAAEIEAGKVVRKDFNGRLVIALHDGAEFRAFDATCTHLACRVNWQPAKKQFLCPCHMGLFASSGERLAGPPEQPLRKQKFTITPEGRFVLLDEEESA